MAMDVAVAVVMGASCDYVENLLKLMDGEYQEAYKRLRSRDHALQEAAVEDRKEIVSKLAEVQESQDNLEYLCALHLRYWWAELDDQAHLTSTNVIQKLIKHVSHENGSLLGVGGFGSVHRVNWLGVQCALKKLDYKDEREATVLKGLHHPSIVRLYMYWNDVSEIQTPSEADGYSSESADGTDGTDGHEIVPLPVSHLLMELMPLDLSRHIKSRMERSREGEDMMPFSLPVAIDIMLQVGQALRYMHEKHLTHRDLKTENIIVRRVNKSLTYFYKEGYLEIKLADFGLTKAYENTSTSHWQGRNEGTKRYGAPEVFEKEWSTDREFPPMADVWSFGVTCSEILSGKVPYDKEYVPTLHARIVTGNLRPTLPKLCPEYLAFIISGCWELQPERRPNFASICAMLRHAKLLSLGISKLDDSERFLRCTPRRGSEQILQSRSLQAAETSTYRKFLSYFQASSEIGRRHSTGEVQMFTSNDNLMQSETAGAMKQPRKNLVFVNSMWFDLEHLLSASVQVLGKGSMGTTYEAKLLDGSIMAVKRLNHDVANDIVAFESQIKVIRKFRCANVLPLCAYYYSEDDKLLVYEYMSMGSLFAVLHGDQGSSSKPLDWAARVKIATGVAEGLAHLHTREGSTYVHANIKSSNILLKNGFNACISDCGLAQLLTTPPMINGYQAPEVKELWIATQKSDVYSFGVLLLELLTSKAPPQAAPNDLWCWVQSSIALLQSIIDIMGGKLVTLLRIAEQCVDFDPEQRPTMDLVWLFLSKDIDLATITSEDAIKDVHLATTMKNYKSFRESYDALGHEEQEMFLDIACVLNGESKDLAIRAWKYFKRSPELGLTCLIEKTLITVDEKGCLRMCNNYRIWGQSIERSKMSGCQPLFKV